MESLSGLLGPDEPRGVAMSEEDIADTVQAFVRAAAADAKRLGFDVVEIHGAHGYLKVRTGQRDELPGFEASALSELV